MSEERNEAVGPESMPQDVADDSSDAAEDTAPEAASEAPEAVDVPEAPDVPDTEEMSDAPEVGNGGPTELPPSFGEQLESLTAYVVGVQTEYATSDANVDQATAAVEKAEQKLAEAKMGVETVMSTRNSIVTTEISALRGIVSVANDRIDELQSS